MEAVEKRMRLRYAGTCSRCGLAIDKGVWAHYDRASRTVRCDVCPGAEAPPPQPVMPAGEPVLSPSSQPTPVRHPQPEAPPEPSPEPSSPATPVMPPVVEIGIAGASARREWERRHAAREERVRARAPRIGGLLLKIFDDPSHTTVWATGAKGEEAVAASIEKCHGPLCLPLHDRGVPRSRANIDHIVVTANGVFVIDAKRYVDQRPTKVTVGRRSERREVLYVGRRDQTKLVEGLHRQLKLVRSIVPPEVPVQGVLCFVDADWPLFGGPFEIEGLVVTGPRKLRNLLTAEGPYDAEDVRDLHVMIGLALPPA